MKETPDLKKLLEILDDLEKVYESLEVSSPLPHNIWKLIIYHFVTRLREALLK